MATLTLNPNHDATVLSSSPTTVFNGTTFAVGFRTATTGINRALLKFNLGTLMGATINTATLSIYAESTNEAEAGNRTYGVHRNTSDFDETTVTWNAPATFDASASTTTVVTANTTGFKDFDVATLLQSWVNATYSNYGVTFKVDNEASPASMNYTSTESGTSAQHPKLVVDYTPSISREAWFF